MRAKVAVVGLPAVAALAATVAVVSAVETVRVDVANSVPRILVDGQPVRARMFWGATGGGRLPIGPQGQRVVFEFSALEDELKSATMHFRFGETPGTVVLDEILVEDISDGGAVLGALRFESGDADWNDHWTVWPPSEKNIVGKVEVRPGCGQDGSAGLLVSLTAPADGRWPDFHIYHRPNLALRKGHRYRVSFWAKAEPARNITVAFYRPGAAYTFLGGPSNGFEAQIKMAGEAGARFVSFPVSLPWPPPGKTVDWTLPESQCQKVLDANPDALLLPRIGVDAPQWWLDAHPDDAMVWDTAPQGRYASVASPAYRRDAAERLAALIAHLEEKFGPHIAGYHPCGQNTGEWFYQGTWAKGLNGYGPADMQAWRQWLKGRYADDAALRRAWGDPQATLDSASTPAAAIRRASPAGALRDPRTERALIDFAEFQQDAMADCVCQLAQAARQASKGRKLVVFFYGYVFEFGPVANGPSTSGHYALRRVLQSPDIDVLCSPISYFDRGLGQSGPAMTAAESVALAGKMWLFEDDTRTHLGTGRFPGWRDGANSIEETNQMLLRNTGQCAIRHFGTWWMDLGATGWFNDPRMWAEMKRLAALDQRLLGEPMPFRPEVAAVIDERAMLRVAPAGVAVSRLGVYEARRALGRMGAPYGQYLQDDVIAGRTKAKMYVFLTAWRLTADERRQLLAATRGSTRLWCYAPGYHDGDAPSLEAMKELTGMEIRRAAPGAGALARPTPAGQRLGLSGPFGLDAAIDPLFTVTGAGDDEVLATYSDGSAAVVRRRSDDGTSFFVGAPGLSAELLRAAARDAGVHLVTQQDCNVYANGPYFVLHAAEHGPLEVDVNREGEVRDLLTGERIGRGPRFALPLKKGETRVLVVE